MQKGALFGVILLLAGCSAAGRRAQPTPELPLAIHWVRNSAEYVALFEQTFRLATERLEERVRDRPPGGWAVAIDADETLIGNSLEAKERALNAPGRSYESFWDAWVDRRAAPALPGARRFLERVHELGGKVAVVTNRKARHCPQTADNLRLQNLPFDMILCQTGESDKSPRWQSIRDGTADEAAAQLEIVLWIGDNIHDFPGMDQQLRFATPGSYREFGERFFILPNPMYGSWEENPPD